MKKAILATTLVFTLGLTSITSGQTAEASEINKEELAQLAQSNASELNNAPLHAGSYNYNFNINGVNYNFESDGVYFSWSYGNGNAQPTQEVSQPEPVQNVEYNNNTQETVQTNNVQYNTNNSNNNTASEKTQTQQPAQQQSNDSQAAAPQKTQSSNSGSTKSQFLAAGGTEAMWQSIVMPESGGNPNAVSPTGFQGLGQTKQSWGTGSVQEQTQGMLKYAEDRYGSVESAVQFRNQNNWW